MVTHFIHSHNINRVSYMQTLLIFQIFPGPNPSLLNSGCPNTKIPNPRAETAWALWVGCRMGEDIQRESFQALWPWTVPDVVLGTI